jgi:hypothetical protein
LESDKIARPFSTTVNKKKVASFITKVHKDPINKTKHTSSLILGSFMREIYSEFPTFAAAVNRQLHSSKTPTYGVVCDVCDALRLKL